jgi:hypothetical protein
MYIGATSVPVHTRWLGITSDSYAWSAPIKAAIRAMGKENFIFKILSEAVSLDEAVEKENYYIRKFHTLYPRGYNKIWSGLRNGLLPDQRGRGRAA